MGVILARVRVVRTYPTPRCWSGAEVQREVQAGRLLQFTADALYEGLPRREGPAVCIHLSAIGFPTFPRGLWG
jgi:hypothetical protein